MKSSSAGRFALAFGGTGFSSGGGGGTAIFVPQLVQNCAVSQFLLPHFVQ
jgi:hypothetical protein